MDFTISVVQLTILIFLVFSQPESSTMFLSYHSLSSFLCTRPPLAMFILSLLLLSVTTLSLALYCRSSPNLHNVDVLDWNKLFTEMSDIKFCLKNSTAVPIVGTSNTTTYAATIGQVEIESNLVAFLPRGSPLSLKIFFDAFKYQAIYPLIHIFSVR